MYDETLQMLRDQLGESQNQVDIIITAHLYKKRNRLYLGKFLKNQRLTANLEALQTANKESRDRLAEELTKKQEELSRLREDLLNVELNSKEELKDKTLLVEQLTNEINQKGFKVDFSLVKDLRGYTF